MGRIIDIAALLTLTVVIALRPLISESYDSAGDPLTSSLGGLSDPSPLVTLTINIVILLAATACFVVRAGTSGPRYRGTGLEVGFLLCVAAAVVSCWFAGNKRLAINASIDWLCGPVTAIGLLQLLSAPWRRKLLIGAILASATAQAFKCAEQVGWEFDETWEHYESVREEMWARQGAALDSNRVSMFEQRMKAREASGFLPHGNITGAYLLLCGVPAAAIVVSRIKRQKTAGDWLQSFGGGAVFIMIMGGIALTGSLGAMMSAGVGIVLSALFWMFQRWIKLNRLRAFVIGWVAVCFGLTAVAAYGIRTGSLPGWSLTFRWQYWEATSHMIADHPFAGVGRENFGRKYLQYKAIESPEEVSNPHNFLMQACAEWGFPGLVGIAVMAIGVTAVLVRRSATCSPNPSAPSRAISENDRLFRSVCRSESPEWDRYAFWASAGIVFVTMMLARSQLLGSDDPNFVYYSMATAGMAWAATFAVFSGEPRRARLDRAGEATELIPRVGAVAGLLAFLLQDLISFALFVPATQTTFFALLGYVLTQPAEAGEIAEVGKITGVLRRYLPTAAGVISIAAALCLGWNPVRTAERSRNDAKNLAATIQSPERDFPRVDALFRAAAAADRLDPTAEFERAGFFMAFRDDPVFSITAIDKAVKALHSAIERDPISLSLRRTLCRWYQFLAAKSGERSALEGAIAAAEESLRLYPRDPNGFVLLGDCLLSAGEAGRDRVQLSRAVAAFQAALQLDERRLSWERLHRLQPGEQVEIRGKIEKVQGLLEEIGT